MKYIRTLVAVPVLTVGITLAVASQASAREIYPEGDYRQPVVVVHDPGPTIEVDDNVAEGLQAGASAIGGAGIALAALWAYRRRHPAHVH
ncbi:hypothetical protein E0H75_16235 [Kribbella capetownensis]|uniref:Uncharacterized protein n=1 Tax=Kribbella capetownensis TaxID=1572659 RepID=A0A4V2M822_9ACTN|nr:hypothetical protein [Kribbella capetownensis]TCC49862.1 hypothetical protein E0H75_16235 [Kribbella capetownensis]